MLSSLLLFFLPHLFPATAKESGGALKLLSRSGRSLAAKRHLGWKSASGEGYYYYKSRTRSSDNHIIHLFTIRLLTAQSAAPAGGRPVRPHHLAPPPTRAATAVELSWQSSAKYCWDRPFIALYIKTTSLNSMRCHTGRQWSCLKTGVMCSRRRVPVTRRATYSILYGLETPEQIVRDAEQQRVTLVKTQRDECEDHCLREYANQGRGIQIWVHRRPSIYRSGDPSVCLSSVCRLVSCLVFVRPTQAIEIFGNVSIPYGTLAICWHPGNILRRSSQGNPSVGGVKHKKGSRI